MHTIWTTERKIIGGFGLALLVLFAVGGITASTTINLLDDLDAVSAQNEALSDVADASAIMPRMAVAARLYASTRTAEALQEWERSVRDFESALNQLEARAGTSPAQRERIDQIRADLAMKVQRTTAETDRQTIEETWGIREGISQMRPILEQLLRISTEERERLGRRNREAQPKALAALGAIGVASLLALILVSTAVVMIMRDLRKRAQAAQELVRAREAAEAASIAKSAFLANMSHELRTPLTSIMGYADLLLEPHASASRRQEFLQTLRRSSEHLLILINDILDVSKIEAGRMNVEIVSCRLIETLADLDSLMRSRAVDKGLEFTVEYLTPVPDLAMTDPTRFRQILMNLVANALKFTDEGSVRVRISYTTGGAEPAPKRGTLKVDVTDTGIGITAEQLKNLFQPFSQADHSTTRRFGGTGLGLSISRRLARMLEGDLTVRSVASEGSTFSLVLPMDPAPEATMVPPQEAGKRISAPLPETVTIARNLGMRILLAEDGAEIREVVTLHLRRAGCEIVWAEDGQQAYEMALKAWRLGNPFDVILMDMQMPVMDGYTATSKLRAEGYGGNIIALTAHAMQEDRIRCMRAGCDEYASKPVDMPALLGMLSRIGGHGMPTSATAEPENPALTQLTRKFVQGLREQVDTLRDLGRRSMWESAAAAAHRLAGAGGAYGFEEITRHAKNAERIFRSDSSADEWVAAVESLREACEAAQAQVNGKNPPVKASGAINS